MKYLLQKKELVLLLLLIGIFIAIRSIHFTSYLNFSTDQGLFSLEALKIYNEKSLTLIGPPMSYSFQGRELFQGAHSIRDIFVDPACPASPVSDDRSGLKP